MAKRRTENRSSGWYDRPADIITLERELALMRRDRARIGKPYWKALSALKLQQAKAKAKPHD